MPLIVIEGPGGTGKTTQVNLLMERLEKAGVNARQLSFPMYDLPPFGSYIQKYLAGEYGRSLDIHPELAGALYMGNFLHATPIIKEILDRGEWVICARYIISNAAYQGSKMPRQDSLDFMQKLFLDAYENIGLPMEDLGVLLKLPVKNQLDRIESRAKAGGESRDGHEESEESVSRIYQGYLDFVEQIGFERWQGLECLDGKGQEKSIEKISDELWGMVKKLV